MDGRQIKEMLNWRALEVCRHLFPGGKVDGVNYSIGDITGKAGQSLKICVEGPKIGVFCDFADPEVKGNNLLELWMRVKDCDFRTAITEAKDFLGVRDDVWQRASGYARVQPPPRPLAGSRRLEDDLKPVKEGSAVWRWLTETRGISPTTIQAFRIGEAHITKGDRDCVVFPFYDAKGNLVRLKYRDIADKKYMFLKPNASEASLYDHGATHHLFGIQAVRDTAESVIIVEGELDAMSFHCAGYSAVSLPIGAQPSEREDRCSHDEWIRNDYDWLEPFVTVYLCCDADEAGEQATRLLIPRLGRERVMVLPLPAPCKDANECLLKGTSFDDIMAAARAMDPEELKRPRDFADDVWERFYPVDGEEPGVDMPWDTSGTFPFRFRPSEVTVWQGYNGHGKTIALDQCIVHLASQGIRSCVASLEIPAAMTLQNIERQTIGKHKPGNREEHDRAIAWLDQSLWIYDYVGTATSVDLLECFEYAARRYGLQHFVVDSMLKLKDVRTEDYAAQEDLLNRLNDFAKRFDCHVHVVCHSKKPDSKHPKERNWPGEYDIKGSGSIPDLAWNVVTMWRHESKATERDAAKREQSGTELAAALEEIDRKHDALFIVQKQRTTGQFPLYRQLWFDAGDRGSWQFGSEHGFEPTVYVA